MPPPPPKQKATTSARVHLRIPHAHASKNPYKQHNAYSKIAMSCVGLLILLIFLAIGIIRTHFSNRDLTRAVNQSFYAFMS